MRICTKDVEKLGFKGSGMFDDSKWYQFYYAQVPSKRRVYILASFDQSISHFTLNAKDWKDFKNGDLSLVPIGCCCASGNKYKENPVVDFEGDFEKRFKTKENTLKFIEKLMKRKVSRHGKHNRRNAD